MEGFAGQAAEGPAQAKRHQTFSRPAAEVTHFPGSPGAGNKCIHWEMGTVKAVGKPLWREKKKRHFYFNVIRTALLA